MELIVIELYTFLTSAPDTVELSTVHRMEANDVQLHAFLISTPDTVEPSTS
jgi:hypothetical protein